MPCIHHEDAACYVAGTLIGSELDDFEQHLITCAECQTVVREGSGVRAAVRRYDAPRRSSVIGTVGAAAAVAVWLFAGSSSIERLGRIDPPAVAGMEVRSNIDSATALADRGLRAYEQKNYEQAAELLAHANALHARESTAFFLGAALLMTDDTDSAIVIFRRISGNGESPYAAEAHFYTAKALLRQERMDAANAELRRAAESPRLRARALALRDSIREAM